jgi:tripartite ATP-independent transporter DctM subunit
MTPIIPPGIGFILYGTVGQVSIGRLFAGGILPGLILWLSLAIAVSLTAKRRGYRPERETRPTAREIVRSTWSSLWAVMFPVMLLVGLRFGIFTPSEIGAFAVVYSIFIGVFAYRELKWSALKEALEGSTLDIGGVMFLIALSGIFGYGIVWERIPELISNVMLGITDNPYIVMLLIVGFLLVAGCFVDGSVLIIMLTPIFLPIATELGFDPVHFGLVFIITITIGNFTPPVGSAMYAVCTILDCPIDEYTWESLPFLVTVSLVAALLIFFPDIVLFVPDLIFGTG